MSQDKCYEKCTEAYSSFSTEATSLQPSALLHGSKVQKIKNSIM